MAKPKIVCVDDREDSLLIRKLMLERFGCDVIAVADASSCLRVLANNPADLALIDYHLNGEMDGERLARAIRSSYPAIALIMLTGDPKLPDSARESVDVLLIKGASNPTDLLDAIENLVPGAALRPRRPNITSGPPSKAS